MNLKLFFFKVFFNGKMIEINKERDVNLCTFKCPFFKKIIIHALTLLPSILLSSYIISVDGGCNKR